MLQKLLVILVGLAMSLVGALSPSGLFAAEPAKGPGLAPEAGVVDETLATVRDADGQAFARVNVLWIEVDGRRVTEDAWGTGDVKELRFKVGVKDAGQTSLAVGDKIIDLHPTDVLTIRLFRGDFSMRGIGTAQSTLQLQGTVKTTMLAEGGVDNRVRTQAGDFDLGTDRGRSSSPAPEDAERVAFVVLNTGERMDTVAVEDGGSRLFTHGARTDETPESPAGNLLATWVKIDGEVVRDYTWGDGSVDRIEFEPAEGPNGTVVLAFDGKTVETEGDARVVVRDFVGEYLVYQVPNGLMRLRLDGYAASYDEGREPQLSLKTGDGAPIADFTFSPANPDTRDNVRFKDRSFDEDGVIVFRMWDFGDDTSSVLPEPTHRFKQPGTYEVTLTVTDNDLRTHNVTQLVRVANALPVPDFDYSPKVVTTDTIVSFTDLSYDTDGSVHNWSWDFGDGTPVSNERHPTHTFPRGGNFSVTLTVADDLGGQQSLSKVVIVRNAPPMANFGYSPDFPRTLEPVQFTDNSTDRDGRVVAWNWSFGDGTYGAGANPNHAYKTPGLYTVSLTATDDAGATNTWGRQIAIANRAPIVNYTWAPDAPNAKQPVSFISTAYDPDGEILLQRWEWGDGSASNIGATATHIFQAAGTYEVTLTVTDSSLQTTKFTRTVGIANAAPRANMAINPSPAYRGVEVTFADTSYDPDHDDIVKRFWDFGDGSVSQDRVATHVYAQTGTYEIVLTVEDEHGNQAVAKQELRVVNRPPLVSATVEPTFPRAGVPVYLNATAQDLDNSPGDIRFEWTLSTGEQRFEEDTVVVFEENGNYTASVVAIDGDGGRSAPVHLPIRVDYAQPLALFSFTPVPPATRGPVNFTDLSTSPNGRIVSHMWFFGDGSTSTSQNPSHVFDDPGPFLVTLQVRDELGQNDTYQEWLHVNARPVANFQMPPGTLPLGSDVQFTDASSDADGVIVGWLWQFGDGGTSIQQNPTHAFSLPGTYTVRLTVTDNNATSDTTTRVVNVQNRAPVARFYVDPASSLRAGSPVHFISSDTTHPDHAYDPDGQAIKAWEWTFGDGSGGSDAQDPLHTYARSGHYRVSLRVSDGDLQSAPDEGSFRTVRIGSDHALTITVRGVLPDGRSANLLDEAYSLSLRVGSPAAGFRTYSQSQFLRNVSDSGEVAFDVTLPAGDWVQAETATVRLQHARFMLTPIESAVTLNDEHGQSRPAPYMLLQIPMPLAPEIEPLPGDKPSLLLPVLGEDNYTANDVPVYTRMDEHFRGVGIVHWADGQPAGGVGVEIEARYVPARVAGPARDMVEERVSHNEAIGWCRAATATTAVNGTYEWEFSGASCLSSAAMLYPAGRWEVRAIAARSFATTGVSDEAPIYVDPTGGTLVTLAGTLV